MEKMTAQDAIKAIIDQDKYSRQQYENEVNGASYPTALMR